MSSAARSEHLVSPEALAVELDSSRPPVLLDVRWHLTDPAGAGGARYAEGHLPGAAFLDLEAVLTRHTGDPRDGRHPLPEVGTVAARLSALGVRPESAVVVYDEAGSYAAERAWWVLRWAGLRPRVLDGGVSAWTRSGRDLEAGEAIEGTVSEPDAADSLELSGGAMPTLDADGAAAFPQQGVLVDARAGERYRGEVEPMDPKAGHIPGAVNAPATSLFDEDGRLPDAPHLLELLSEPLQADAAERHDARPVAVYCGSGVSASRVLLALAVLDVDAALVPGSWSAWSNHPARPVATG